MIAVSERQYVHELALPPRWLFPRLTPTLVIPVENNEIPSLYCRYVALPFLRTC